MRKNVSSLIGGFWNFCWNKSLKIKKSKRGLWILQYIPLPREWFRRRSATRSDGRKKRKFRDLYGWLRIFLF